MNDPEKVPPANAEDIRAAYHAGVEVALNLGTARFAQAALFVAAQLVLITALGQPDPGGLLHLQPFIPLAGIALFIAMIIFELRNSEIADTTHDTVRSLEARLRCGDDVPTPFLQNAKTQRRKWISHHLGLLIVYGIFALMWAALFGYSVFYFWL
jgi:hypothetical protein